MKPTHCPSTIVRRARSGFTLLELIIVLVLFGLLLGTLTLNLNRLTPTARLHASARNLASTLIMARELAIVNNADYQFVYKLEDKKQRYFIRAPQKPEGEESEEETQAEQQWMDSELGILDDDVEINKIYFGPGKSHDRGEVVLTFTPRGTVQGHAVHLTNTSSKEKYTVTVNPITGLVRFYEGHEEYKFVEDNLPGH